MNINTILATPIRRILYTLAFLLIALQGRAAFGQVEFQVGAQVCQYMNVNQAKFIQYRSEGVLNTNTSFLWVVCPLATEPHENDVDINVLVSNRSDTGADVQCIWKLTDEQGNTQVNRTQTEFVPQGAAAELVIREFPNDSGETVTVSCKLPPNFLLISFQVGT